jgi:hypothetical protein
VKFLRFLCERFAFVADRIRPFLLINANTQRYASHFRAAGDRHRPADHTHEVKDKGEKRRALVTHEAVDTTKVSLEHRLVHDADPPLRAAGSHGYDNTNAIPLASRTEEAPAVQGLLRAGCLRAYKFYGYRSGTGTDLRVRVGPGIPAPLQIYSPITQNACFVNEHVT